jgi:molybdopterin-synthase adenylyltransferase
MQMSKPRIKQMHNPRRPSPDKIRIGGAHFGIGSEIEDPDGRIWPILKLIDGTRSLDEIVGAARSADPELSAAEIREVVETLTGAGFVEDAAAPPPPDLTPSELERYDRSAYFFAWIDLAPRGSRWELQQRLKAANVTVLGLGGAGSAAAMSLVASGVGSVHCVDFDVVEKSNLNRQLLYNEEDIGLPKVERAVERLRLLNSDVEVSGHEARIEGPRDLEAIMEGRDLLVMCADRPPVEIANWSSDAAAATGTPWVMSFYNGPAVVVGTFVPFEVPCFRCIKHHAEVTGQDAEAGEFLFTVDANASLAPAAAMTGHLAALEAIFFATGRETQARGRIFHLNLIAYDHQYFFEGPFWDECPACGTAVRAALAPGRGV